MPQIDANQTPAPPPLECRDCGCHHFYTVRTTPTPTRIVRIKECRFCGARIRTSEIYAGQVAHPGPEYND